jgi:hypothetical protein
MDDDSPQRRRPDCPMTADTDRSEAGASSAAPDGLGSKLRRLGSESLVYGLSSIVGRLLSYLLQPYYAHAFDPAQNGVQSVVYSYIPIISIALYLGMDVAYMRNAALVKQSPLAERQRAFSMSFGMVVAIGGVITGFAIGAAPWLAPFAKLDVVAFRYMMAIVYTDALLAVPYAHLRMVNRSMRYAVLRLLFVAASIGLNVVLIGHFHWGVEGIFMANLAANLSVLALFIAEIAGLFRPGMLRHAPWRALWKYALPIIPAMLAVMLVENGDRIVLNYLPEGVAHAMYGMTSKDVVGIYSFNYKLGVAMLLVVQMFRMAWSRRAPALLARAHRADADVRRGLPRRRPVPAVAERGAGHSSLREAGLLGRLADRPGDPARLRVQWDVRRGDRRPLHRAEDERTAVDRRCGRSAQHRDLHCGGIAVGDGRRGMGDAGGLRAHGGTRRVAVEQGVSGAIRMGTAGAARADRRRALWYRPLGGVARRRAARAGGIGDEARIVARPAGTPHRHAVLSTWRVARAARHDTGSP